MRPAKVVRSLFVLSTILLALLTSIKTLTNIETALDTQLLKLYPYVSRMLEVPPQKDNNPTHDSHRMTWEDPMEYDISIYATPVRSYYMKPDTFFDDAQLVYISGPHAFSSKYPYFSTAASINLPESVLKGNGTMFLHMFAQATGLMNPHPNLGDNFVVLGHSNLIRKTDNGSLMAKSRVFWDVVFEDHEFAMWKAPHDIRQLLDFKYKNPNERRAYNPIIQENPAVLASPNSWTHLQQQQSSLDVSIAISGVPLEWLRLVKRLSPRNTDTSYSAGPAQRILLYISLSHEPYIISIISLFLCTLSAIEITILCTSTLVWAGHSGTGIMQKISVLASSTMAFLSLLSVIPHISDTIYPLVLLNVWWLSAEGFKIYAAFRQKRVDSEKIDNHGKKNTALPMLIAKILIFGIFGFVLAKIASTDGSYICRRELMALASISIITDNSVGRSRLKSFLWTLTVLGVVCFGLSIHFIIAFGSYTEYKIAIIAVAIHVLRFISGWKR